MEGKKLLLVKMIALRQPILSHMLKHSKAPKPLLWVWGRDGLNVGQAGCALNIKGRARSRERSVFFLGLVKF